MTDYDSLPGINASSLKLLLTSPLAYRHTELYGSEDTPSKILGTATHCAILEPRRFDREYRQQVHHGASKAGKEERELAEREGVTLLRESDWCRIYSMASAVNEHPECLSALLAATEFEVPLTWTLEGRACKGRMDALGSGLLLGLKTVRQLSRFPSEATRLHYPLQWAWYHDGLEVLGRRPSRVVEIVVESAPPYDVACYVIPDVVIELGRAQYRRALALLDRCELSATWPGAYPGETLLVLPDWAYNDAHPDEEVLSDDDE